MNLSDLYYTWPQAAYLFFFIFAFLVLFWSLFQYRTHVLQHYTEPSKLRELLIPQLQSNFWMRVAAFCMAWICLCFSLMGPKGNAHYPHALVHTHEEVNQLHMQPHEVIFMMDTSASMAVKDGRLGQSRLDNAKDIVDQIMSQLQGQSGSLYAFTSQVTKLSPPSMDYLFMRLMLRNMSINEGDVSGTDIKAAVQFFQKAYLQSSHGLIKTLIILSDGGDNHLDELTGSMHQQYLQEILSLLGNVSEEKLHVYTIGMGTKKGGVIPDLKDGGQSVTSHLEEEVLKAISDQGLGRYYAASEYAAVDIAADLSKKISHGDVFAPLERQSEINPEEDLIYDLYFQFPLGVALLLLTFCALWPKTQVLKRQVLQSQTLPLILAFVFLGFYGNVNAAEKKGDKLRLAEAYFSAGAYPESIEIYQQLLNQDLSEWEKSVVLYNLGTVWIAAKNEDKGVDLLKSLLLNHQSSPLLLSRLYRNLTVGTYRQARTLGETLKSSLNHQDIYYKSLYYYNQTLEDVPLAQDAECRLLKMVGDPTCQNDRHLKELEILSKLGIAEMRLKAKLNLLEQANLQQGIPWLLTGLHLIEKDLNFLIEKNMSSSLKQKYKNLFLEEAKSWQPLWHSMHVQSEKGKIKHHTLFNDSEDDFNKMLLYLSENDFIKAKSVITSAIESLNQYLRLQFAADPFQELISKISNDFSIASLQDPLESNTLLFLEQELNELSLPKEYMTLKSPIEAIEDHLEHSLGALQDHQNLLSLLYFNEAWDALKRIQLLLHINFQENPEMILEVMLDIQRHALTQTRLLSRLVEKQKKIPEVIFSFALSSQEYLKAYADYFYNASYTKQRKQYDAKLSEGEEDLRCQYYPWSEVNPLFDEGNRLAQKAAIHLKIQPANFSQAMQNQEKVLVVWSEALEKIKSPPRKGSCHSTPLASESAPKSQQTSFEDVARLIQQMNAEDQSPIAPPSSIKQGLKPW